MSSVVNISDLRKVPGVWVTKNIYKLPEIKTGNRLWSIFIELNTSDGLPLVFKDEYYNNNIIPNARAFTYTEYGVNKIQTSAKTEVFALNLGKSNATNIWTQALRNAISTYNKYAKTKGLSLINEETLTGHVEVKSDKYPPLLLNVYGRVHLNKDNQLVWMERVKSFEFEHSYIQPKLDGERCIAYVSDNTTIHPIVSIYSRTLEDIPNFVLLKLQLSRIYEISTFVIDNITINPLTVYLDGELYNHGMPLQDINSIVRTKKFNTNVEKILKYYIFDCFIPSIPQLTFTQRHKIVKHMIKDQELIIKVPTYEINSEHDAAVHVTQFLKDKYEGGVLKSPNATYEYGYNNKHSSKYLKIKQRRDDEYVIVDFECGKGKDNGAIIWKLKTENGIVFNVVPKAEKGATDVLIARKNLYNELSSNNTLFREQYYGKYMRVEFEDLSKDGVPLRGKAVGIRKDA